MDTIKAVIFDIDGTLSQQNSWTSLTMDLGASVKQHEIIYQNYFSGKVNLKTAKKLLVALWQETGNANKQFITELFRHWPLREDAEEIIKYLKKKKLKVSLITGSFDLYAEVIARRLKILHFYASSRLIWDNRDELADFEYPPDQASRKFHHFLTFCETWNINPQQCVVIGDDENDTQLFSFTKKGVAIKSKTSHKIEHLAWKKIESLLEIKDII